MLSSWKEIAHFFGKGVRTVQRWEKTLDLPIHRPPGAPSNVVLARTSDLEEWMHRGAVPRAMGEATTVVAGSSDAIVSALGELERELERLAQVSGVASHVAETHAQIDERIASAADLISEITNKVTTTKSASRAA